MTPEGKVKKEVKKWLEARGIWYAMPMGTGYGRSGVPDFICCWQGKFLAIETKAPGREKNTTVAQDRELAAIAAAGGTALVISTPNALAFLDER